MKLRLILVLLIFILTANDVYLQTETPSQRKNIIHVEAGGVGGYGSLNYERTISLPGLFSASGRIGFSTIKIYDYTNQFNPDLLFPISMYSFFGDEHKVQIGFGQLIANSIRASHYNGEPIRETNLHTHFSLGYRYQKQDGRLILGISYTPILEFQETLRHWGALTIGYTF